ncbi:MAG: translesion DNA synthesis-associated protein ImuA [Gammaproteobacteria bacterium]|nr:translesion DNA synthesis-associated protein ImuA [Gammaproteobacteria bacterium]
MNQPLAILPALLARHPHLRRAASAPPRPAGIATGNPHLDALLCWHGWPRGALTELLGVPGHGELALLAPTLIRLAHRGGQLFLVDPPHQPHAQGLQQLGIPWDRLLVVRTTSDRDPIWACEQILHSGTCAALLAWEGAGSWRLAQLLRLQSAARAVPGPVFLCRPARAAQQPSPAVLRLRLAGAATGAQLTLVKQPGPVGQQLALASSLDALARPMIDPPAAHHWPAAQCLPIAIRAAVPASIPTPRPEDALSNPNPPRVRSLDRLGTHPERDQKPTVQPGPVEGHVPGIPGPLSAALRAH